MGNFLSKNIAFLRKSRNINQSEIQDRLGFKRNTWSNWENGISSPDIPTIMLISDFFGVNLADIIQKDLSADVHLNTEKGNGKNAKNVHLNVHPSVHLNAKKSHKKLYDQVMSLPQMELNEPDIDHVRQQNLLETLSTAVRALERANAQQERIIAKLEEENSRLKTEIPEIGKPVKASKARAS
jgi:transcriptional regulator with XRE-family HTH domain